MPKIGHIVLSKGMMQNSKTGESVLLEPFTNIDVEEFPHKESFTVTVGLFNLEPDITYNFAYFLYTPTGEKIKGDFFEIKSASRNGEKSIYISLNINLDEVTFTEEGVHHVRFQITNLHEEKSTFFYVKKKTKGESNE